MKKANNQWKRSTSVVMAAMLACSGIQIPVQAKETESWLLGNAETAAAIPEAEVKTAEAELSQEDTGRPSKAGSVAYFKVVRIMSRSNLNCSSSLFRIRIYIFYNRNFFSYKRQNYFFAN